MMIGLDGFWSTNQLTLQKGDHTIAVRMDATKNQTDLDNYFKELKGILDENKLEDKPGQIYNMDKSGIPLDHCSPCVLARKNQLVTNHRLLLSDA